MDLAARGSVPLGFNPLYIYSDVGLGKTHLLSAIANAAKGRRAILINMADLELEEERGRRLGTRSHTREWLVEADILLFDDIQLCEDSEALQLEVFAVLNHMIREGRMTAIASDVPPTRLRGITSRLISRLGSGVIVGLAMGDKNERAGILGRHLGERELPREVIDYLAENVTDSVRRLKAAANQLIAMEDRLHIKATVELARAVVPMAEDIVSSSLHTPVVAEEASAGRSGGDPVVNRFKEMLTGAESQEEQTLALEIALSKRLRQLRLEGGSPERFKQLEVALESLRNGKLEQALRQVERAL